MASMTDFRWNLAIELLESVIINSYFFEEYSRKKNLPSSAVFLNSKSVDRKHPLNQG